MDFSIVASILVGINILVSLWCLRIIVLSIKSGMAQLDTALAGAIQKVVEGNLGDFEPVNPIQAALAQMLTNRIENGPIEIPRATDGKFSSEKIS